MSIAVANLGTAPRRKKKSYCAHQERVALAVENKFPEGTAKQLSALCGLKVRACFKFLARESSLSSGALHRLFDTPLGADFFEAFMGGSTQAWVIEFKCDRRKREAERMERQLKAITDARSGAAGGSHDRNDARSMRPAATRIAGI